MGFRFQKRIRIFKGLTLNISKSGTSWTVGGPGASVNVRGDKVTGTVGAPCTGLSYRQTLVDGSEGSGGRHAGGRAWLWVLWAALLAFLGYLTFGQA